MSELADKQVYMYKQKYLSRGSRNPPKSEMDKEKKEEEEKKTTRA